MAYLYNDPTAFAAEMTEGFVAANSQLVRAVHGGVIRSSPIAAGRVAVVIGGGSGHYPAFAGLVGHGLAAGAAMGDVFASPSAQQIYAVAKAADAGGGVLFGYGNYAGDVLNFDLAQARLRTEGIDCRTVVVTDDVSSAPAGSEHQRRGVAGGLIVYKIASAAAETGAGIAEVSLLAQLANSRTRTIGIAFSGCTLPGASAPLFQVTPGVMQVGMGVHGESGLFEASVPSADAAADLFVRTLLDEAPPGVESDGARVAVVLNGLGSVKTEELYVVYRSVARLLGEHGIEIVGPEVGEFVTSFEMAGCSLSLCWLTSELEELWNAPAYTSAYKRGAMTLGAMPQAEDDSPPPSVAQIVIERSALPGSVESRRAAEALVRMFDLARIAISDARDELGRLDSVAGDGDHGIGMVRGVTAASDAARDAIHRSGGVASVLRAAADAWSEHAGGTSGALWGIGLEAAANALGDDDRPTAQMAAASARAAADAIAHAGKAMAGDKTMLDAMLPFAVEIETAAGQGDGLRDAWDRAALSAQRAAEATADLLPRMGRARPHAHKSVGTPDPGAVSFAILVRAVLGETGTVTEESGSANERIE